VDECGVCGGSGIAEGACDCDGNVNDECGVCGGDGTSCKESSTTTSSTTLETCIDGAWLLEGDSCDKKKSGTCCSGACLHATKKCARQGYCADAGQKVFREPGRKCKKDHQCCSGKCENKRCTEVSSVLASDGSVDFGFKLYSEKVILAAARLDIDDDDDDDFDDDFEEGATQDNLSEGALLQGGDSENTSSTRQIWLQLRYPLQLLAWSSVYLVLFCL